MVFVGRRRKRSEIIEATFAVETDFAGSRLQVRSVDILLRAGIFLHLIPRGADQPRALIVNRLGVELRIDDCEFEVQVAEIGTRPALDHVHLVTVRIGVFVRPGALFLERDRIDHERVALPFADFLAEKRRVGILAVFRVIDGNQAIGGVPVEESDVVGTFQ